MGLGAGYRCDYLGNGRVSLTDLPSSQLLFGLLWVETCTTTLCAPTLVRLNPCACAMEIFNTDDPEFQELGIRVSRMRVSLRMKKRNRSIASPEVPPVSSEEPPTLRVPLGPCSNSSNGSGSSFRPRLSSHSSICSTDSGVWSAPARSRVGSTSTSSSALRTPGSILTRIAARTEESSATTLNADSEFSMFYRPVTRSSSSGSASSRASRHRSVSVSSAGDYSLYSDLYSTIDELCDPFDEPAPPLPPRKARLRPPMLPPYPSSAVRLVNNISETILC